jgi:hypothetical protein
VLEGKVGFCGLLLSQSEKPRFGFERLASRSNTGRHGLNAKGYCSDGVVMEDDDVTILTVDGRKR